MVKVIDIDLERRRISLSLKQANEGGVAEVVEEFDPTIYGMAASYDESGNYLYPEGFDSETNEWLPGYEKQQAEWEAQYAQAHARWEAHRKQVEDSKKADVEAAADSSYSSSSSAAPDGAPAPSAEDTSAGTLASDEALQALREKLTGG